MIPLQLWVHYEREFSKKRELIRQQQIQQEEIQKEIQKKIQQKQQEKTQSVDRKDSQQDSQKDTKTKINKNNKFTNPLRNFWG